MSNIANLYNIEHEDLGDVNDQIDYKTEFETACNMNKWHSHRYQLLLEKYEALKIVSDNAFRQLEDIRDKLDNKQKMLDLSRLTIKDLEYELTLCKERKTIKGFKLVDYGDESNEQ